MKYIWEAVTKNRLCGAMLSDVFFVPARNFSPYMEVNSENLNETCISGDLRIEVNPFIRFHGIFGSFMRPKLSEYDEYRNALFDIIMHFLLATDKKSGHNSRSILRLLISRDIRNGLFGREIGKDFALLDDKAADAIADGLIFLYEHGVSVHLHGEICKRLFENMISYMKVRGERTLLIYHGISATRYGAMIATLCRRLFLPANMKTEFYWDKHFGIIGIPETMKTGEMVLI
ncbi:MAG: hypothetical protein LBK57_01470 [Clostridiales Family XIII bacterium]|jgi:hypothetical protein|nr:hypothetical protein [Clostridiales Family XIII bacterium]